ncbi:MAG: 4'-phosphopantetheinyl transferase superfamily protein [Elusimicrobia bacterium]|nr:4'-phosphopantetheinyl transferase superfamily protein [Elusimicrobiota bacterium]
MHIKIFLAFQTTTGGGLAQTLTTRERSVFEGFITPKRRREWAAGRVAAKRAVRQALAGFNLYPRLSEIEILADESGKPRWNPLKLPAAISLSISHSNEWACAAVSTDSSPIGIDIEKIEERHPAWLEEAFAPEERAGISSWDQATKLWTEKEAYSKFLGIGLNLDLWKIRPRQGGARIQNWKKGDYWVSLASAQGTGGLGDYGYR